MRLTLARKATSLTFVAALLASCVIAAASWVVCERFAIHEAHLSTERNATLLAFDLRESIERAFDLAARSFEAKSVTWPARSSSSVLDAMIAMHALHKSSRLFDEIRPGSEDLVRSLRKPISSNTPGAMILGTSPDEILRLSMPLKGSITLVIDLLPRAFAPLFGTHANASLSSFLLTSSGQVFLQDEPARFRNGEDISSFHSVGWGDLRVVSQVSSVELLSTLREQAPLFVMACGIALALVCFCSIIGGLWLGKRAETLLKVLCKLGHRGSSAEFPRTRHWGDEFGEIARELRRILSRSGPACAPGAAERTGAVVLAAAIRGFDRASSSLAPDEAARLARRIEQEACDILARNGATVLTGSLQDLWAYWPDSPEAPDSRKKALTAAMALRKFARSQRTGELKIRACIHAGDILVAAPAEGVRDRWLALGDCIEIAGRIRAYADPFDSDFLITEQVAGSSECGFECKKVSEGDENCPELYELGKGSEAAAVSEPESETKMEPVFTTVTAAASASGTDTDSASDSDAGLKELDELLGKAA